MAFQSLCPAEEYDKKRSVVFSKEGHPRWIATKAIGVEGASGWTKKACQQVCLPWVCNTQGDTHADTHKHTHLQELTLN